MFDGIDLSKINLNEVMGQFQEMADKSKEQNASQIFTSKSGGGMVSISINGNSQVIDLQIDDTLLDDKDSLNILLISAISKTVTLGLKCIALILPCLLHNQIVDNPTDKCSAKSLALQYFFVSNSLTCT